MFLIILILTFFTVSDASTPLEHLSRSLMHAFYHVASDAAFSQSARFEKPEMREKVYYGGITNTYRAISPDVNVTIIKPPVIGHKGLYNAIELGCTFIPNILYTGMFAFYAWLPHVPGATHILMTRDAFNKIAQAATFILESGASNPGIIFEEQSGDEELRFIEYPKHIVPQINSTFGCNISMDVGSVAVMLLNFLSACSSDSKTFHDRFHLYFINSRIEMFTIPNTFESPLKPYNIIPNPDIPIAFRHGNGIDDVVMMQPEAIQSQLIIVIAREKNAMALLHLYHNSCTHPMAVQFFNKNSFNLINSHFSARFKLSMHLLEDFKKKQK